MKKPKPWPYRESGSIRKIEIEGAVIHYRQEHGLITKMCLGERYASLGPGMYFVYEEWIGSYIDNWHGGIHTPSVAEAAKWVAKAEHPEWKHSLWMLGPS